MTFIEELRIVQEKILTPADLKPYSDYYGVHWTWSRCMWEARLPIEIVEDRFAPALVYSSSESECAEAYNIEATRLFGDKAILNENIVDTDKLIVDIYFPGIYQHKKYKNFQAQVYYKCEFFKLGAYTKAQAIIIYNNAIRKLFSYRDRRVHKLNGEEI